MSVHPIAEAFPNAETASTTGDAIRQKLAKAFPLVLESAAQITTMDFTALDANDVPLTALPWEVRLNGIAFIHDPEDEATEHDPSGLTCLVSFDGKRFKSALALSVFVNVLSIEDDLPEDAELGDKFLVSPAPDGDFAGEANNFCLVTSVGPVFVAPGIGQNTYVRALPDRGEYQWEETGAWVKKGSVSDGGVTPLKMKWPWGAVALSETATPPVGTPAAGLLYVVAPNGTGAFDDHDTQIAEADGAGGFGFHLPYNGAEIFDDAVGIKKRFESATGLWLPATGSWVGVTGPIYTASGSTSAGGSATVYTYSDTVPPATSLAYRKDDATITHRAKRANALLRLTYSAKFATDLGTVALYRNEETDAIGWYFAAPATHQQFFEFLFPAINAAENTYHIRWHALVGTAVAATRRTIMIEEGA